jgi:hypothetical protein
VERTGASEDRIPSYSSVRPLISYRPRLQKCLERPVLDDVRLQLLGDLRVGREVVERGLVELLAQRRGSKSSN